MLIVIYNIDFSCINQIQYFRVNINSSFYAMTNLTTVNQGDFEGARVTL